MQESRIQKFINFSFIFIEKKSLIKEKKIKEKKCIQEKLISFQF